MGASSDTRVIEGDRHEIQSKFDEIVQDDLMENGIQYSGSIGMLGGRIKFLSQTAEDIYEAEDIILDKHDKWDPAMAVSVPSAGAWVVGGWCSS